MSNLWGCEDKGGWIGLATGLGLVLALGAGGSACGGAAQEVPGIELPGDDKADSVNRPVAPESCPGGGPRLIDGRPATWTIMHYAAGDNNLEQVLMEDINEMELGHSGTASVNVIVQLDRYGQKGVWRYRIEPDGDMDTIHSELVGHSDQEPDSGDWHTLALFGKWAATCYPADNYMVIIGGHGNGWSGSGEDEPDRAPLRDRARHMRARRHGESLRMIAPDDTNGSEIYIDQLAMALKAIRADTRRPYDPDWRNRLVAYGSDACLMETVEVAYELRNAVTYLLGSEETEPMEGWPYNTIIRELTGRPSYYATRPHELAALVVDNYGKSYSAGGSAGIQDRITFAAVDTGAAIRARNRVDSVSGLLLELVELDPGLPGLVMEARDDAYNFGDGYVDLGRFMRSLREVLIQEGKMPAVGDHWDGDERWRDLRNVIDELMEEVWPELVVASMSAEEYPLATGLSIFMPRDQCGWGLDLRSYALAPFAGDTRWDELVTKLVVALNGGGVDSGFGYGTIDVTGPGEHSFVSMSTECELDAGILYVYSYGEGCTTCEGSEECIDNPEVSFDLEQTGDGLVVTGAYLSSKLPGYELDTSTDDLQLQVADAEVFPASYYAGTVVIPFEDPEAGQTVQLTVDFECDDFETYGCDDYDDWW